VAATLLGLTQALGAYRTKGSMKRVFLNAFGAFLLTACASAPATIESAQANVARHEAVDPIDPLQLKIAQALATDKNVVRAYLTQKESESGNPIYVLAPIFENEYPQAAIDAAYSAFHSVVPGGKLELWLVPKREYKKYFAQAKPIYVRP
jgi:hypothetical protein